MERSPLNPLLDTLGQIHKTEELKRLKLQLGGGREEEGGGGRRSEEEGGGGNMAEGRQTTPQA